jgi:IS4 transposase
VSEPVAISVADRGYLDFARPCASHQVPAFFVIRSKFNSDLHLVYSKPFDKVSGVRCDQIVALNRFYANQSHPDKPRRVKFYDDQHDKRLTSLTNQFTLPAVAIADLYRCRWQVELLFKWIKQHLRIKAFYSTTENAVKTQTWIIVSVYVLVAIVRKRMQIDESLYTILQILSVTLF